MLRKIIASLLTITLLIMPVAFAQTTGEMTILEKLSVVEKSLYGSEQTASLVERLSKLEKDLYGSTFSDALTVRLDNVYSFMEEDSPTQPSFLTRLNAVEWSINHVVTTQPAKTRLENVEHIMLGNSAAGPLDGRLTKLFGYAFANGKITVGTATLAKDTLVKIKFISALDSKSSRVGDIVIYQAAEDVYAGGLLVIPSGAQGFGKITKVAQARNFGRDAQLEISFDSIQAIDSTEIKTVLGEKAKEQTESLAKAAGATVAGLAILGPIGVVGGAFVHGKDVTIPAGSELYIQTAADAPLHGLQVK